MNSAPIFFACGLLLLAASAANGQMPAARPERPYRGLFGGGVGDADQLLTANLTVGGGYDDNVLAEETGGGGIGVPTTGSGGARSGYFGELSGGLNYSLSRGRASLGASAGGTARLYSSIEDYGTYQGTVGGTLRLSKRASITGSQSAGYQPFVVFPLFPQAIELPIGQEPLPSLDFQTTRQEHFSYDTVVQFSHDVGRRGSIGLDYARHVSDFQNDDQDLTSQTGHFRYTHGISKGLAARFGYGYTQGRYPRAGEAVTTIVHNLDVGVDFSRALSFSRKTTFSFATGSSAMVDRGETYYRLTGDATLNHEIGRTWNASLVYQRGLEFVETFGEPFFSDALSLSVTGLINRRLQLRSGLGSSVGTLGLGGYGDDYDNYFATVGLELGLSRSLGLGVEYSYYRQHFDADAALPPTMPRDFDRNAVHCYVNVWAPLVQRSRRSNASR